MHIDGLSGGDLLVVGTMGVLFLGALILPFFDTEARAQHRSATKTKTSPFVAMVEPSSSHPLRRTIQPPFTAKSGSSGATLS